GVPMLGRVLAALHDGAADASITVAIDEADGVYPLLARFGADRLEPAASPASTVAVALERFGAPLLIVTADHALLTGVMVQYFLEHVDPATDGVVALARRPTIEARYQTRRTYWRFAGAEVSGCNLFYLGAGGRAAVAFWRLLEADRKKPWRVVRHLGLGTLIGFLRHRLTLDAALVRLSRVTGATLGWVDMPFAEAAIDVDKPEDLILAEAILQARGDTVEHAR
ncbi:MAG: NTP transferase domain-containing protein, partial [Rhizomicrobium sp.]